MTISAALVMQLRERTGAGMMECKKFLTEANGDIEKAITEMRKAGQAKADKKAGRVAAEGAIVIARTKDMRHAVMLEINSETDFVARDENFKGFSEKVAQAALEAKVTDTQALLNQSLGNSTVEQARQELVSKIGENIQLRRLKQMESPGVVGYYLHSNRIGVMLSLSTQDETLAKDIAMHIAATRPLVVAPHQVDQSVIQKEKEIFMAQAGQSGKPKEIIEKMIEGRMKKYLDEVSLLGQAFVKDPNKSVGQLLSEQKAEVLEFTCFEVGEGIEKKENRFVEEVMEQVRK